MALRQRIAPGEPFVYESLISFTTSSQPCCGVILSNMIYHVILSYSLFVANFAQTPFNPGPRSNALPPDAAVCSIRIPLSITQYFHLVEYIFFVTIQVENNLAVEESLGCELFIRSKKGVTLRSTAKHFFHMPSKFSRITNWLVKSLPGPAATN